MYIFTDNNNYNSNIVSLSTCSMKFKFNLLNIELGKLLILLIKQKLMPQIEFLHYSMVYQGIL